MGMQCPVWNSREPRWKRVVWVTYLTPNLTDVEEIMVQVTVSPRCSMFLTKTHLTGLPSVCSPYRSQNGI